MKKVLQVYVYTKNRILHGDKVLFAHIVTYSGSSVNRWLQYVTLECLCLCFFFFVYMSEIKFLRRNFTVQNLELDPYKKYR